MIKKLLAFLFVSLVVGVSCLHASAEEVEVTPDDYAILYSSSGNNIFVQELERSVLLSPFTDQYCPLGTSVVVSDSVYLFDTSASNYLSVAKDGYAKSFQDWSMNFTNCEIGLDMSNFPNGYYRYSSDLYFGIGGAFTEYCNFGSAIDLKSSYTYTSAPFFIADSESGMHCTVYLVGETSYQRTENRANAGASETFNLIHIYIESTFQYDSTYGTDVVFQLKPWFDTNISSLSIDCSPLRSLPSRHFDFYVNNRWKSSLVGNVEPPVTPTPSPTPYPGQDTQESINAGVQQIVSDLNINATPIPTPAYLEIDETIFDEMTLPDVSSTEETFTNLWDIFDPLWSFIGLLAGSLLVVGVFCYILRGGFI